SASNCCGSSCPVSVGWRSWPILPIPPPLGSGMRYRLQRRHSVCKITTIDIRQARDIAPAFDAVKGHIHAAYICADALVNSNRIDINIPAAGARLPTMDGNREYVEAGGLISYGPNLRDSFRRAADYVDKILRGAKPAELPVEQPTKFDLVVNAITAQA